jgi:hypothetical protein
VGAPRAYCCGGKRSAICYGGTEESKGGNGEEEKDGDAAFALPKAVAPVRALCAYCCGSERSVHCCGGAEESKGGGGEEEKGGDAAAALPRGSAQRLFVRRRRGEEGMRRRRSCFVAHAVAPVGAPSAAAAGLYGEWQGNS